MLDGAALQTGKAYNGREIVIERPLGDRITVLAHANPIENEWGQIVGSVNVLVDITSQKAVEATAVKLNELLEMQVALRTASLRLIQDVAMEANKARNLQQAIGGVLRRICEYQGWPLGHAFCLANDKSGELLPTGIWHVSQRLTRAIEALVEFRRASARMRVLTGEGIIGRVAALGQPVAIDDVERWGDPRYSLAPRLGLRAVFAFPVSACNEVAAVLEFFSSEPIERGGRFLDIVPNVAIELGHVIESPAP